MIEKLSQLISAVCPIDGISIGRKNDKATWRIDFKECTEEQKSAALSVVKAYDFEAEEKAVEYVALRAAAYPPIVDQLDTIFHGGLDAWKAEIQAVKTQFPKEVA
jgi:hypothetical protein